MVLFSPECGSGHSFCGLSELLPPLGPFIFDYPYTSIGWYFHPFSYFLDIALLPDVSAFHMCSLRIAHYFSQYAHLLTHGFLEVNVQLITSHIIKHTTVHTNSHNCTQHARRVLLTGCKLSVLPLLVLHHHTVPLLLCLTVLRNQRRSSNCTLSF
jgi:hypothetical protein